MGNCNTSFSASGSDVSEEDSITSGFNCSEEESFPSFPARGFDAGKEGNASSSGASNLEVNASSSGFDAPEVGALSSYPSTAANSSRLVLADAVFLFLIVVPGLGDALSLGGPRLPIAPREFTLLDGKT